MTSTTQSASRFPIPNWASILFSSFPLIQFEPATVYSQSSTDSNPSIATLFIQNPHPTSIPSWPSSDPISLKHQLELSLRGIQFKCKYLHQQDSFGGPLPFLILPNPPGISRPNLVKKKDLDRYLENYLPFDYERQELKEEDVEKENERRNPYKDEKLRLEAATWKYTLHREGLAGVLLASLFLSPSPPSNPNAGFLSRTIQSQSSTSQFTSSLSSIAHLSGLASLQASERAMTNNGWFSNVTWGGPAVISNGATNAISLPEEEEEEEVEEVEVGLEMRDEIIQKSVELIEAIGRRDEQIEGEGDWFFGASSPTSLDAILFSILHTILSLPQPSFASSDLSPLHQEGLKMSSRLRKAVESHPRLMRWTRNVWEKQVRDKKVEEIDLLSR